MYLRFETLKKNEDNASLEGVFQAAFALRDSGKLSKYEQADLEKYLNWFNMHMKAPGCLKKQENRRAICWFHPRAKRPVTFIRHICFLLEEHGIHTQMIKSADPGIIIYEDGWQIAAKPYRK